MCGSQAGETGLIRRGLARLEAQTQRADALLGQAWYATRGRRHGAGRCERAPPARRPPGGGASGMQVPRWNVKTPDRRYPAETCPSPLRGSTTRAPRSDGSRAFPPGRRNPYGRATALESRHRSPGIPHGRDRPRLGGAGFDKRSRIQSVDWKEAAPAGWLGRGVARVPGRFATRHSRPARPVSPVAAPKGHLGWLG